jgi:hypothetical protein
MALSLFCTPGLGTVSHGQVRDGQLAPGISPVSQYARGTRITRIFTRAMRVPRARSAPVTMSYAFMHSADGWSWTRTGHLAVLPTSLAFLMLDGSDNLDGHILFNE